MPDLNELLKKVKKGEAKDLDGVQEERGGLSPLLQPGTYEFALPGNLVSCINPWDDGSGFSLSFRGGSPLMVAGERSQGEPWFGSITGGEGRNRSAKGEPENRVSDVEYLLIALGESGSMDQHDQIKALAKHGGEHFVSENEFSGQCSEDRVRYLPETDEDGQATGGVLQDPDETKGCGKWMNNRDFKLSDGTYAEQAICSCGAAIRPRNRLLRFRAAA